MRPLVIGTGNIRHPTLAKDEVLPDTVNPRLEEAAGLVAEGARRGCDFFCLPELFADPTQGLKMDRFAEPEGGVVTTWLARQAAEYRMNVVATVALRRGQEVANTGVVFDRRGSLVARYRKVHLPDGEKDIGTPGDGFPVFEVDGVRLGMQICFDMDFPEGWRILALRGADIVFWPNMFGGMPEEHTEVLMKARAIDSRFFVVSSGYLLSASADFRVPKIHGRTCIVDPAGVILAEVGLRLGVATAVIDIDALRAARYPEGGDSLKQPRLPHLYGEIAQ